MPRQSKKILLVCKYCRKEFLCYPSRVRLGRSFCNSKCQYAARQGVIPAAMLAAATIATANVDPIDRFVRLTIKDVSTGCILWAGGIGKRKRDGYGNYSVKGNRVRAHRFSYAAFVGTIPDGLGVLHRCDNRQCVNPAHLFVGTNATNVHDMVSKGRNVRGEDSNFSKLKEIQVLSIRRLFGAGETCSMLAKRFGLDYSAVRLIVHRKRWKNI